MKVGFDAESGVLVGGVAIVLIVASVTGWILARRPGTPEYRATIANLNARTRAWWVMVAIFLLAMISGGIGSVILFGLTSFLALREFVTMTPTKRGDHGTLLWVFFIITPIQYVLVAIGWYGLFSIFIPVYAFLFVPLRSALAGDCERFLERTATIQWALMVCVYCVSHAPALMTLQIPGFAGQNGKLLFYFVLVVQASDVLQYHLGETARKAQNCADSESEQDVGGVPGRHRHGHLAWNGALVGHPIYTMASCGHVPGHYPDGLCRRSRHVRHQARSRSQGLWNPYRRTWRSDGPD